MRVHVYAVLLSISHNLMCNYCVDLFVGVTQIVFPGLYQDVYLLYEVHIQERGGGRKGLVCTHASYKNCVGVR